MNVHLMKRVLAVGLMISTKQIATLLLLIATALPDALGAEDKSGPKFIPELQTAIESILKETKTPGAAIAIVSRDKAEWVAGIGMADEHIGERVIRCQDRVARTCHPVKQDFGLAQLRVQANPDEVLAFEISDIFHAVENIRASWTNAVHVDFLFGETFD